MGAVPCGDDALDKDLDLHVTGLDGGEGKGVGVDAIGVSLAHGGELLVVYLGVVDTVCRGADDESTCIEDPVALLHTGAQRHLADGLGLLKVDEELAVVARKAQPTSGAVVAGAAESVDKR